MRTSRESRSIAGLWSRFRSATARLWIRLLAFNLLLVFLPVLGIAYLDVYEAQLVSAQERSMVQQGRVLAAALGDSDLALKDAAELFMERLGQRTTARLRVMDRAGEVLADSSQSGPRSEIEDPNDEAESLREMPLYRLGSWLFHFWDRWRNGSLAPQDQRLAEYPVGGSATLSALEGRYGAATRISPGQRSVTFYSAIPIRNRGKVVGAVLVSQSTLRILSDLVEVRLAVFRVVLASVLVAAALSLWLSATIVRPVHRLRMEALEIVDRKGRLRGRFRGSSRRDEIGDLSRALETLSLHLQSHLEFIESFAADVSHEFRNPLATVRSALEVLQDSESREEQDRLVAIAMREIARMEHLLVSVRDITLIDARLESGSGENVAPALLVEGLLEAWRVDGTGRSARAAFGPESESARVSMDPDRLAQVITNLMENAWSYSPEGSPVEIALQIEEEELVILVRDEGRGFPEEHRGRLFDRFFSYRDGVPKGDHAGLGLAIVKAIAEGAGGSVSARNRVEGGAEFEVRLPLVDD